MTSSEARIIARTVALSYLGTFYSWGGDDPDGFDCSGLCIEILKSVGILPRKGDWTANGLWSRFSQQRVPLQTEGCLVFWYNSSRTNIIHVEYCLNDALSIGASGGGSKTLTKEDAKRDNAFVKIRPTASRTNVAGFVNPFLILEA